MGQRRIAAGIATRAIEYSGLVALVGGVFLVIVIGGGAVFQLDAPHAGLTLAATVLLAITFEPLRRTLRRLANRFIYGHRSSPWEAVSRLSAQMGYDRDPVDLLHELTAVARAGTGARAVSVWLLIERMWLPTVGPDLTSAEPVADDGPGRLELRGADLIVPIRHGGEVLGALTVTKSGPDSLTPFEHRLVMDLASQAGIITQTLHLWETLRRRLEVSRQQQRMLVASRAQVIAAQDEERRRLERDIHDTCQQQAVVLAGRLGLAGALTKRDPAQAQALLDEACADVARLESALRSLTSVAPMAELAAHGIGYALRTATAGLPVAIDIEDTLVRRYRPDVEATVYFCCAEAIQNATKHAKASRIELRLSEASGWLTINVRDDGVGFDVRRTDDGTGLRNIRERLRPWQGRLAINSSSTGTHVAVEIPVAAHEASS